jgi:hypothetical protein
MEKKKCHVQLNHRDETANQLQGRGSYEMTTMSQAYKDGAVDVMAKIISSMKSLIQAERVRDSPSTGSHAGARAPGRGRGQPAAPTRPAARAAWAGRCAHGARRACASRRQPAPPPPRPRPAPRPHRSSDSAAALDEAPADAVAAAPASPALRADLPRTPRVNL